jgi:hypothetical protein
MFKYPPGDKSREGLLASTKDVLFACHLNALILVLAGGRRTVKA